jgi:methylmalonyl-CoA mutase N-terminal domain/subunit
VLDIVEYCMAHVPRWNTLNIAGYHFREAGADAIQELAFTLADAITYIEQARQRGMDVDAFAPRLSYSLGCYMDLFEEVAKFRAGRRLFAKIMKTRFQAKNPKSYLFRIFSGSCGSTLVAQQPINNIVRVTMHALMGILGGHQAIHTACWDEGFALPSEDAARLALRTQQILAHECGLCNTVDPLAGSYYLESLTNEIESRASAYIDKIDAIGGMLDAIDSGFVHREIQEASVAFQKRVDSGERLIVGLNAYEMTQENESADPNVFEVDSHVEAIQCERLAALKKRRDPARVARTLDALKDAVKGNENLMPCIIDAVKAYATVGEICRVMREQWGEYTAPVCI